MNGISQAEMERGIRITLMAVKTGADISQAAGSLAMLMEEVGGGEIDPLSLERLTELNNVALGLTPEESVEARSSAEEDIDEDTVLEDRSEILKALHADTFPQAVRIGIELGMILVPEEGPPPEMKPQMAEALLMIAEGKSPQRIQRDLEVHRNTVTNRLNTARDALEAKDLAHAVYKAYVTGLFKLTESQRDRSHLVYAGVGLILSAWGQTIPATVDDGRKTATVHPIR